MKKPGTRLATVNGLTFEHLLTGSLLQQPSTPALIFLNGYRMDLHSWHRVYEPLADTFPMLLYNRLGVGKSSKPQQPQQASRVVGDLRELLDHLNIPPPYTLVVHSMGGLMADYFARCFPEEVAGIVFVDCPHPDEIAAMKKFKPPIVLRAFNALLNGVDKLLKRHANSEAEWIDSTVAEIKAAGEFPAIPVAVVTGIKPMPFVPKEAVETHLCFQKQFADYSPLFKGYEASNSSHFPQLSEPEIVIMAIKESLNAIQQ